MELGWATVSLPPHSAQKVARVSFEKPHAAQTQGAGAPHSTQNLAA
jgi:hypothetical protein